MKAPLFVRPLTSAERQRLQAGLRCRNAFTVRRSQILLGSAAGKRPARLARELGCTPGTVRNAIHAFHSQGVACLSPQPPGPRQKAPLLDATACQRLRALLHESPRRFGVPQSTWTLHRAAEVALAEGLTPHLVSHETVRLALKRLGSSWKRAKHWITSPDPAYARKKTRGIG